MKRLIVPVLCILILASCEEEVTIKPAIYAGRYTFESPEVKFAFELIREYGIYKGINGRVTHEAITNSEGRDNFIVLHGWDGSGYDQIIIRSDAPHYRVTLKDVRFTEEGLNAAEIHVTMPGAPEVVLSNQFIFRK